MRNKGIYLSLLTALISGISIFVNKFAVSTIAQPLVFTAVKNAGVALLVISLLLVTKKHQLLAQLSKGEKIYLLLIGLIGGTIPFYLFFTGLSMIPAINAALLHKSMILWVAILATVFLRERMTKVQVVAICALFISNVFVGGFKGFTFSIGELMVLGAAVLWAVENILAKKILPQVDPDIVVSARMGIGSLGLLSYAAITSPHALATIFQLNTTQWFWLGLTMVTLLGYVMTWYRALSYAPAITVTTVLVGATLVTNLLSALFVTHTLHFDVVLQSLTMILMIGVFLRSTREAALPEQLPLT